ncbi:MAG: hypothetical protein QXW35_00670 [Candidatus Aenigmatarchaeota archaeon]
MPIDKFKKYLKAIFLVILGGVIGIFLYEFIKSVFEVKNIEIEVKKFYELLVPNSIVSVESIKKDGEMYKVLVKLILNDNVNYIEAWVSRDSSILVEGVIYLKDSVKTLERYKNFVECLNNKGVKIYGLLDSQNYPDAALLTSRQLNLLGRYSYLIFVSCDGDMMQVCIDSGITQFPAIVYNDKVYFGVNDIDWFSNLTGCKF